MNSGILGWNSLKPGNTLWALAQSAIAFVGRRINLTRMSRIFCCLLALACASAWAQSSAQALPAGPAAQSGKTVVFIASDYRNGGVMGVYRGFEEASGKLGWKLRLEDGGGLKGMQAELLKQAVASRPHGIVFGGFEPTDFADQVAAAKRSKIVLLVWMRQRSMTA